MAWSVFVWMCGEARDLLLNSADSDLLEKLGEVVNNVSGQSTCANMSNKPWHDETEVFYLVHLFCGLIEGKVSFIGKQIKKIHKKSNATSRWVCNAWLFHNRYRKQLNYQHMIVFDNEINTTDDFLNLLIFPSKWTLTLSSSWWESHHFQAKKKK